MNIFLEKYQISEFSELLINLPMFNELNNKEELKSLFEYVLNDIYIETPNEVLSFLKNQPSKKFLTLFFMHMGIDESITKKIPEDFKLKLIYSLNKLFEVKGTIQVYRYLADIMEDMLGKMNFYNITVEQETNYIDLKNQTRPIIKIEYLLNTEYDINGNIDIDGYRPIEEYYLEGYPQINLKNRIVFDYDKLIKYHIIETSSKIWKRLKITLGPNEYDISNGNNEEIVIYLEPLTTKGEYKEFMSITDSETHGTKTLKYKLKPVYIMDDKNILTEIEDNFKTQKYFQKLNQFITRKKNIHKKNCFPIHTNVLYIQNSSDGNLFDTMKIHPDLMRIYSMTKLQDRTFLINIGNYSSRIPLADYLDILTYIKIEELKYKYSKDDGSGYNGYSEEHKKFDNFLAKYVSTDTYFTNFTYHKEWLPIIEKLLYDYKTLTIDNLNIYDKSGAKLEKISAYKRFHTFKKEYLKLLSNQENIVKNIYFNQKDFRDKLSGNKPDNIPDLIKILEMEIINKYSNEVDENISTLNQDLIKSLTEFLYFIQEEWSLDDFEVDTYIELLENYNQTIYDIFKNKITIKYPRLILEIEKLKEEANIIQYEENEPQGANIYFYTFLKLYKQIEPDILKETDIVKFFIRDIFSRFLMGNTFKNEFYDPIIDLFNNYFFNVDQSYFNEDISLFRIKDKMNFIPTDSVYSMSLDVNPFSKQLYCMKTCSIPLTKTNNVYKINDRLINRLTNKNNDFLNILYKKDKIWLDLNNKVFSIKILKNSVDKEIIVKQINSCNGINSVRITDNIKLTLLKYEDYNIAENIIGEENLEV